MKNQQVSGNEAGAPGQKLAGASSGERVMHYSSCDFRGRNDGIRRAVRVGMTIYSAWFRNQPNGQWYRFATRCPIAFVRVLMYHGVAGHFIELD